MSTLPNYVNNSQPSRPVRCPLADPHYQSIATWSNTTAITGYGHMRATSKLVKAYQVSCWICWKAKCCASSRCCRSANFERCPVDTWPTGATHSSCTSLCLQAGVLEVEDAEGKADCMQWKPFVDLRSGELKATSLRMRVYKQDANGTVTYEAANCNLKGERCNSCAAAMHWRVVAAPCCRSAHLSCDAACAEPPTASFCGMPGQPMATQQVVRILAPAHANDQPKLIKSSQAPQCHAPLTPHRHPAHCHCR